MRQRLLDFLELLLTLVRRLLALQQAAEVVMEQKLLVGKRDKHPLLRKRHSLPRTS